MNKQNWMMGISVVVVLAGTALMLGRLRAGQKLGSPGVKTSVIHGSVRLQVDLPERVLDFESKEIGQSAIVTNTLPRDTSYGQRLYWAPDGFQVLLNVVLMGTDRTSLHKPEFCLVGDGWRIDSSEELTIPIAQPQGYQLPVIRKTVTKRVMMNGQPVTLRGHYLYWYVADQAISGDATGLQRMWWMAKELLRTGVLQRWAYVTCFSVFQPGQEEATFNRMQQFIVTAVPEFQLTPRAGDSAAPVRQ